MEEKVKGGGANQTSKNEKKKGGGGGASIIHRLGGARGVGGDLGVNNAGGGEAGDTFWGQSRHQ